MPPAGATTDEMESGQLTAPMKQQVLTETLTRLAVDLRRTADSVQSLTDNPGPDQAHFATEGVRLAAQAQSNAQVAAEHLAYLAHQEPNRVPLQRLAKMLNVSLNALRNRMGLNPSRSRQSPPFSAF